MATTGAAYYQNKEYGAHAYLWKAFILKTTLI
jgi:hypothetical protein